MKKAKNKITPLENFFNLLDQEKAPVMDLVIWHKVLSSERKDLIDKLNKLFKPLKNTIEVDMSKVKEYRELFPEIKLPTGSYARVNERDLESAFQWFFKNYPAYIDWEIVLQATQNYVEEYRMKNWEFMSTSLYFIRKMMPDKSYRSYLANYYERVLNGTQEENGNHFIEKIV